MTVKPDQAAGRAEFGKYIRARRMAIGMTQAKLAEELGLATPVLCNLENHGIGNVTEELCGKVATVLGVDPDIVLSRASLIPDDVTLAMREAATFWTPLVRAFESNDWTAIVALGWRQCMPRTYVAV